MSVSSKDMEKIFLPQWFNAQGVTIVVLIYIMHFEWGPFQSPGIRLVWVYSHQESPPLKRWNKITNCRISWPSGWRMNRSTLTRQRGDDRPYKFTVCFNVTAADRKNEMCEWGQNVGNVHNHTDPTTRLSTCLALVPYLMFRWQTFSLHCRHICIVKL
jgi:hypothetical protein